MRRPIMSVLGGALAALAVTTLALAQSTSLIPQNVAVLSGSQAGTGTGVPASIVFPTALFTDGANPTDLAPLSQFVDGYTFDLTLSNLTPAGTRGAYTTGWSANTVGRVAILVNRPGYDSSGSASASQETIYATSDLRGVYSAGGAHNLPTETASGANAKLAMVSSDFIYAADTASTANVTAGLYTSGSKVSLANAFVPVTKASVALAYPPPICAWVTEPGLRLDGVANYSVEAFCGHLRSVGGGPVAAVKFTLYDAGAAHSVTKIASTPTLSTRQLSASCTATNGSSVLSSCGSTAGFYDGMRVSVAGISGQPKLLSHTSTSLTFGQSISATCATNTTGVVTVSGTPGVGEALADGAFVGATISDANLNGGVGTITSEPTVTYTSNKATSAAIPTNGTPSTAQAAHACTINHTYQGTTGAVTVTAGGGPVTTYKATFTPSDLAGFSDGLGYVRLQAYPAQGNVVLDSCVPSGASCSNTGSGADGTGKDWNGLTFSTAGTNISASLHNLWNYIDQGLNYAPVYAFADGTGGGSPAVQTAETDPGSAARYVDIFAAATALKAYYNTHNTVHHNNDNGGVIDLLAGTYAGGGSANVQGLGTALAPPLTIKAAPGVDATAVTLVNSSSKYNFDPFTHFRGLTIGGSTITISYGDGVITGAFNSGAFVFDNVIVRPTGASTLYKPGVWWVFNSLVDEHTADGNFLKPSQTTGTGGMAMALGNTVVGGSYTANTAGMEVTNALGNATFGTTISQPLGNLTTPTATLLPTSYAMGFNKFMNTFSTVAFQSWPINNMLDVNNVIELINNTPAGTNPALQVSSDGNNMALYNISRMYDTVMGGRTNLDYLQGVPTPSNSVAVSTVGGALAAGSYYLRVIDTVAGVEVATDGYQGPFTIASGTTGKITFFMPPDPAHSHNVYIGTTINPVNYATVSAADAIGVAGNQNVVVTAIGSAHTPAVADTLPGHNELKLQYINRFNLDAAWNSKGDVFSSAIPGASGARIGNWASSRWRPGDMGNVAISGSSSGTIGNNGWLGEVDHWKSSYNPASDQTDVSWVRYKSDRSWGNLNAAPTAISLNLGEGNYCRSGATTHEMNRVPAGYMGWPYDIQGRARLNDGTDPAGAYGQGCQ
jgi:hypothetical protein